MFSSVRRVLLPTAPRYIINKKTAGNFLMSVRVTSGEFLEGLSFSEAEPSEDGTSGSEDRPSVDCWEGHNGVDCSSRNEGKCASKLAQPHNIIAPILLVGCAEALPTRKFCAVRREGHQRDKSGNKLGA